MGGGEVRDWQSFFRPGDFAELSVDPCEVADWANELVRREVNSSPPCEMKAPGNPDGRCDHVGRVVDIRPKEPKP